MRILYICHRIPYPPNKGDKIRAFHQLQALAARHEVDLFTLADHSVEPVHESVLREYCQRITVRRLNPRWAKLRTLPSLFTETPLTLPYFYSKELSAEIRKAVHERSYNRIFVYCSAMAQYVEWVERIPMVMDLVDVDSDKWTQYAAVARFPFSVIYRREGFRLEAYEREICERFSSVLVSTEREAQLLRRIAPMAPVQVIPNGVDTDFFRRPAASTEWTAPTIVFTGDMSYFPNEQAVTFFALEVLPVILRSVPNAKFLIVGRDPSQNVRRLEQIEGVEVTGFVADVRTYLAKAQVAVAPFSIAAGIQNKILEAMAYGLPVVATSRAVQGLLKAVAEIVETGNSAEELAAKTVRLLSDSQLAQAKGMEGRRRVTAEYTWKRTHECVLQLLENPRGLVRDEVTSTC